MQKKAAAFGKILEAAAFLRGKICMEKCCMGRFGQPYSPFSCSLYSRGLFSSCSRNARLKVRRLSKPHSKAVASGVGLAGCHGGMCDSFRQDTEWQFMTGGQWVSHPGGDGIDYMVNIRHGSSPIVEGLEDFPVCSEHYYLHIDPSIEVLATTRFPLVHYYHISNKPVDMPVAWTKFWGNGRVFYTSLGHHDDVFDKSPNAEVLMKRGMCWAGDGKQYAKEHHLTTERFENTAKMY